MVALASAAPTASHKAPVKNRPQRDWVIVGLWIALLITALFWLVPFFVMVLTSFKS
ncbi:Sugar ABC superfamily ATP binding cassette transporter, membrane protein, partial [human gut metagenome]